MDGREQRALMIAATTRIEQNGAGWRVPSQSSKRSYRVSSDGTACTCPDYETRGMPCKHTMAVVIVMQRDNGSRPRTGEVVVAVPRRSYPQVWSAYNAAQCEEGERFPELLADLCSSVPGFAQSGRGRPAIARADRVFCAVFKVYTGRSLRRSMSDVRAMHERGLIDTIPHFNSVANFIAEDELTTVLTDLISIAALPLKVVEPTMAADATGFSTCAYERWFDYKHGKMQSRQQWVKLHAMVGTYTNVVTAAIVTPGNVADISMFQPLLDATTERYAPTEILADRGYVSRAAVQAIEDAGAVPYITDKANMVVRPNEDSAYTRMYHRLALDRPTFLEHYHQRSNVEATFSAIKRKFGERLYSKSDTAQRNEVLCKVLCHNICCVISAIHELGIEPNAYERQGVAVA
jgi:hypothetical protein